jgi:3-phosphoshikimate 1-carboxyvinyltransferase
VSDSLLCIVGPTASGKSALAVRLARRWDAEVISVDASQVYRGLNIGTAKITTAEMDGVTHHLIDCVSPDERFDVATFCERAEAVIASCRARGVKVILCGGTGLYFKALIYGLCQAPPISEAVRADLRDRIKRGEVESMYAELKSVDPLAASRIKSRDKQRIERALGVYLTTGTPLSEAQSEHGFEEARYETLILGVDPPRDLLNTRIAQRVEEMFTAGLELEVRDLQDRGYSEQLQSMSAIGYRLTSSLIEGELTQAEAQQRIIFATRQYARRQRRYFDRQLPTEWLSFPLDTDEVDRRVEALWGPPPIVSDEVTFEVTLPGDKSIGHRALIFAALADGVSVIDNIGRGEDLASTRSALGALGVEMTQISEHSWRIEGTGFSGFKAPAEVINCGNSGTSIRLLAGLLSGLPFSITLDGDASLRRRPMRRLERVLAPLGRSLRVGPDGGAPISVGGDDTSITEAASPSKMIEIFTQMSSAQLKSAALLAGLTAKAPIRVEEVALSRDHTERMMHHFGLSIDRSDDLLSATLTPPYKEIPSFEARVPGDFSSAAFWLAVGALAPRGVITLRGVNINPSRMGFLEIIQSMGVSVEVTPRGTSLGEPFGDLRVHSQSRPLRGLSVDPELALRALDELPLVALLASVADGETLIWGAGELRVKESDRIEAMTEGLSALGAQILSREDGWRIDGLSENGRRALLQGGQVRSHHDHRVALCFVLAQLCSTAPIEVEGVEIAAVSYPEFPELFEDYKTQLNAQ